MNRNECRVGSRRGPLVAAAMLLGAGLGGFADGILFHQIFQWHNMLSARLPPDNLIDAKVNMFWDGIFHAGVWALTVAGIVMLFRAGSRPEVPWRSNLLAGGALLGWGLFNVIEGLLNHHVLGLHHVMEYVSNPLPADLAFLASGVLLTAIGMVLTLRPPLLTDAPYRSQRS